MQIGIYKHNRNGSLVEVTAVTGYDVFFVLIPRSTAALHVMDRRLFRNTYTYYPQ